MRWRHPATVYLLAALVQVAVAVITRLLIQFAPNYAIPGVLEITTVALVAMFWGAGPGVFTALVRLVLEETVGLPAIHGEDHLTGGDYIEGALFLAIGIGLSLVASATERSRRKAAQEQAAAEARAAQEQAAAEARAAQAREAALRETQEQMDAFVAIASHDLRSPLAAALGFHELAAVRYERLSAAVIGIQPDLAGPVRAVRTSLQEAGKSMEHMRRLVDLLFDTTQVRAGKLELHPSPCDLAAVVQDQVAALRVAHPGRTLQLQVPREEPVPVVADADRIGQVVTNFVTNALKYSPADQPVAVQVGHAGRWARVAVEDHGPGLPAREQERIWGRFYQAADVRAQRESGTGLGLGLHICKAIIEGHGGQVGVESEVDKGSRFWFTLRLTNGN